MEWVVLFIVNITIDNTIHNNNLHISTSYIAVNVSGDGGHRVNIPFQQVKSTPSSRTTTEDAKPDILFSGMNDEDIKNAKNEVSDKFFAKDKKFEPKNSGHKLNDSIPEFQLQNYFK